ncbi:lymphocyte activation gene 3 protein isoform X2 [Hyla sarda]|uniref:lymphocyte activation gene 3 protein isoform X2 n=1 Tax=Hyla sarda TaxID=327740 RepID=UPI0024C2F9B4|nr:lymphocyte activation gene 3 protein isoform X2 [Hyla sarda]
MYAKAVCLLLLSTIIPVSAVQVTGVLGGEVILPCTMTKNLVDAGRRSEYPISSVHWQRKDRTPRTVLKLLPSGVTYTVLPAVSRALVQTSLIGQGIFSLHLKNLKERDAGTYYAVGKCGKSKTECLVRLRTVEVIQFPGGPLPENSAVNLTCRIVGPNNSSTSVRWLHRGNLVQPSSRISVIGRNLHFHSLTQEDHGEWSCAVDGVRSSVTLLVVGISGPDPLAIYTAIGSSVKLPCNITHLPMEKGFHWSKDAKTIRENKQVVSLNNVRPEDAGSYQCSISYKGKRLTRHIELRVIQVSTLGSMFTKEGSHLKMLCNISGSTGKERFQWTGPSLPDGQRIVIKGPEVDLPDVRAQDSGAWTCSVYGMNEHLGEVEHWVYVHAAQTADVGSFTSWHILLILIIILVSCLAAISFISFRNHKRRLSHLTALSSIDTSAVSQPKNVSVSE